MADQLDAVDFAFAAFRRDGEWQLHELALDLPAEVGPIAEALRRLPGDDAGVVALIGIDEGTFVLMRSQDDRLRLMLSDAAACGESDLADSVADYLDLDDDLDDDDLPAVGDLDLLTDLGFDSDDLTDLVEELIEDDEMLAEEALSEVAELLGFADLFDDALDLTPA